MAKGSSLFNRIISLIGRGYTTTMKIVNKIRQSFGGKNITVANIKKNIEKYNDAKSSAKSVGKLGRNQTIGEGVYGSAMASSKTIRLNFHLFFQFPSNSSSGRRGRQDVHLSADVPTGMTKQQVLDYLNEIAKEWIEKNYDADTLGRTRPRLVIDLVYGV